MKLNTFIQEYKYNFKYKYMLMQTFNIKGQYKSALTESKITDKCHFCFCVFRIHLFGRLKNFISVSLTELFIKENTF